MSYVMTAEEQSLASRLLQKSKDSFSLAIELYNRPLLSNKVEACSILLANAWELLLKSFLLKREGMGRLLYPNSERSLSLEDCVSRVMTNENDPLRLNLMEIISLRNSSTHFLVDEYEVFYGPVLQASVSAYVDRIEELHGEAITELLPRRSLLLPVSGQVLDQEAIREKYDKVTAEHLLKDFARVRELSEKDTSGKFAHYYEMQIKTVKNSKKADLAIKFDKHAQHSGIVIKELQNPNDKYPHTRKIAIESICKQLRRKSIKCLYRGKPVVFNSFHWDNVVKAYGFKTNDRFSVDRSAPGDSSTRYTYSGQAIEFVVESIESDPAGFLDKCREKNESKNKESLE